MRRGGRRRHAPDADMQPLSRVAALWHVMWQVGHQDHTLDTALWRRVSGLCCSPANTLSCVCPTQVALPHEIQELPDSALAPDVAPNTRVSFASAIGEHPQAASIIAMQTDAW
jgi:hypothetical protein